MGTRRVAITGATGYMGRRLTSALLERGHRVNAVIRPGSQNRVVQAVPEPVARTASDVTGGAASAVDVSAVNVFSEDELSIALQGCDTVVHLIGTPHPNPRKAEEFLRVDLASVRACAPAAVRAGVAHFVYVSVAHPAPVMKAYVTARADAERIIESTGLSATVLRPWYVLGPGHWWPVLLLPFYAIAEMFPPTRERARRLGLVTLDQMTDALVAAVERPPPAGTQQVLEVPDIRRAR